MTEKIEGEFVWVESLPNGMASYFGFLPPRRESDELMFLLRYFHRVGWTPENSNLDIKSYSVILGKANRSLRFDASNLSHAMRAAIDRVASMPEAADDPFAIKWRSARNLSVFERRQ